MIGWILRRSDPRVRLTLLVLALPLVLLHRIAWGLVHRPAALFNVSFYDRFFFVYYGMLMTAAGDIERMGPKQSNERKKK